MEDTPTPEPVLTVEWWKSGIMGLTLAVVAVVTAFGGWHPTDDQIVAISAVGAALIPFVFTLVAYFVRKRVTPTEKVALTKAEVQLIDAAQGPPLFTSPAKPPGGNGE